MQQKLLLGILCGLFSVPFAYAADAVQSGAPTQKTVDPKSCSVKAGNARTNVGDLHKFGDLKILTTDVTANGGTFIELRLDAPGLNQSIGLVKDRNNVAFIGEGKSVNFKVCGQDVTIAYRHEPIFQGGDAYRHHIYVTLF